MDNQWTLYAGKYTPEIKKFRFSHYEPERQYVLVFTDENLGDGFIEVSDDLYRFLSAEAKKWLAAAKLIVESDFVRENQDEINDLLYEFLDAFEIELKAEEEKIKKEGEEVGQEAEQHDGDIAK